MSINDLELFEDELPEVNRDQLPDMAPYVTLQPGAYVFEVPRFTPEMELRENLEKFIEEFPIAGGSKRLRAVFAGMYSLKVGNERFSVRLSNQERKLKNQTINDLAYLANATGWEGKLSNNRDYASMLGAAAGKRFKANVEFTATCNTKNDVYGDDGKPVVGIKGCGQKYRMRAYEDKTGVKVLAVPRDGDKHKERFRCECGASLRAFPALTAIRSVE